MSVDATTLRVQLDNALETMPLPVTDGQRQQLVALVGLLAKWNKAYNLTSVREPQEMMIRHILDSLVVSPYLGSATRLIDVGTGPGLPGLPLAIINPDRQFFLLDSLGKRIRFIRQVLHELELTNVTPVQSRVEAFQPDVPFDAVLSRAFTSLQQMLDWCHHLVGGEGCFLALKGQYPEQEIKSLQDAFLITDVWPLQVPGLEGERHLVKILPANMNAE